MLRPCPHCKNEFNITDKPKGWMANHVRWCDQNPKLQYYKNNLVNARSSRTAEGKKMAAQKISKKHADGAYAHVDRRTFLGKHHSEETKSIIRQKALASTHRRLKKNTVLYNGILLDSSWELELAKRLDFLNIRWVRPEPIKWSDDAGIEHNYFPDFYLVDHDVYLDPKNQQAIKSQLHKLKNLLTQHKNVVILQTLKECKSFTLDYISTSNFRVE